MSSVAPMVEQIARQWINDAQARFTVMTLSGRPGVPASYGDIIIGINQRTGEVLVSTAVSRRYEVSYLVKYPASGRWSKISAVQHGPNGVPAGKAKDLERAAGALYLGAIREQIASILSKLQERRGQEPTPTNSKEA